MITMQTAAIASVTVMVLCSGYERLPSAAEVIELLDSYHFREEQNALLFYGSRLFPTYLKIMKNNNLSASHTGRLYGVIGSIKANRKLFVEHAIKKLHSDNYYDRWSAVGLIDHIGNDEDRILIGFLLFDEKVEVAFAAARSLSKNNNPRALDALEIWLRLKSGSKNTMIYRQIENLRNQSKSRLLQGKIDDKNIEQNKPRE